MSQQNDTNPLNTTNFIFMKKILLSMVAAVVCFTMQAATVVDVLTIDCFNFTETSRYLDVTYTSSATGITYTGNIAKSDPNKGSCIQFRRPTTDKESGLVIGSNPNGYKLVSIKVEHSTVADSQNKWDVYGKATAYTGIKDLFDTTKAGTLIGSGTSAKTITSTDGYTFVGLRSNTGAIYLASITLTYESGGAVDPKEAAGLAFSQSVCNVNLGDEFTAPTLSKQTDAAVSYTSSKTDVATVDAATGAVTLVGVGTTVITATAPETENFHAGEARYSLTVKAPVSKVTVSLVKGIGDGKYIIACEKGVAKNYTGTNTYGYVYVDTDYVPAAGTVTCPDTYLYTFTHTEKGYTIQGANGGKYYGMDATHFGSFNYYDSPDASGSNCYWDVTFDAAGNAKISNIGRSGCYLSWKQYNADYELYLTDNLNATVQLYTNSTLGVNDIVVEDSANAPVEYYNLQGVRVSNPENGLYIRVQGKNATKVLVK